MEGSEQRRDKIGLTVLGCYIEERLWQGWDEEDQIGGGGVM